VAFPVTGPAPVAERVNVAFPERQPVCCSTDGETRLRNGPKRAPAPIRAESATKVPKVPMAGLSRVAGVAPSEDELLPPQAARPSNPTSDSRIRDIDSPGELVAAHLGVADASMTSATARALRASGSNARGLIVIEGRSLA